MADLLKQIEQAGAQIQVDWTPERLESNERKVAQRRERRARLRTGAAAAVAVAFVALVAFFGLGRFRALPNVPEPTALAPSLDGLRFPDGSVVSALQPGTVVRSERVTSRRVEVSVASGAARFDVMPNRDRTFLVHAGDVSVRVVGTRFTVARDRRVTVAVERGEVLVTWPDGHRSLTVGQQGQFPPPPGETSDGTPSPASCASPPMASVTPGSGISGSPTPVPRASTVRKGRASWRALAKQGQHEQAYEALEREGMGAVRDNAEDLMLAADVARISGHSAQAVTSLQKVLSHHAGDPRAPLAAFTLGRVWLDDLGRPGQAASAFATARRLAPHGALAQDALAREVESLAKAGQAVAARERALEYMKHYPNGRRKNAVRRYGGLE